MKDFKDFIDYLDTPDKRLALGKEFEGLNSDFLEIAERVSLAFLREYHLWSAQVPPQISGGTPKQ